MKLSYIFATFLTAFLFLPNFVLAYQINKAPVDIGIDDNFSVYPNKFDLRLEPGAKETKEIIVTNHSSKKLNFELSVEDFSGGSNAEEKIKFLGDKSGGKFSLKNYIKTEINSFTLSAGEQILFNAEINIPQDIKVDNGLYAALMTSAKLADSETAIGSLSRVATLFLVKVDGIASLMPAAKPSQYRFDFIKLNEDEADKILPKFKLTADNQGQYHLAVLGDIKIFDWRKKEIEKIETDFWYILPESKAEKIITVSKNLSFGRYEAKAEIIWKNPISGAEEREIKNLIFWILPGRLTTGFILALIGAAFLFLLLASRKIARRALIIFLIFNIGSILIVQPVGAILKSENYKISKEAIDMGGADTGTSENYRMKDQLGETAGGSLKGTSYNLKAGFRVPESYEIAISTPSDATMSGCTQSTNCVPTGTVSWTVTTDNPNGYTLSLSAATSPALKSGSNYFSDFSLSPRLWSVDTNVSAFGFAVGTSGQTNVVSALKDNGTTCGSGSNIGNCYRGFNGTNSIQIVSRSSRAVAGNITTVKLKAEVGIDYGQPVGAYTATITATAAAL